MATMGFTRQKLKIANVAQCILMAIALAAIAAVCVPAGTHAATVYDDLFDTQGKFIVNLPASGNGDVDVTNFMSEYMSQVDSGTCKSAYDYFLANESNPYFFRTAAQDIQSSSDQKGVIIYFGIVNDTTTTDLEFDFDQQGSPSFTRRVRAMQPPNDFVDIYALSIGGNPNGTYGTDYSIACSIPTSIALVSYTPSGGQAGNRRNLIFARGNEGLTVVYNYPVGYEGNESPWENPPNVSEETPNIQLRGVNQWKGEFSDNNFLTIDNVPFTCADGLTPVIHGELWNDNESPPVLMDTFTANASGLFNINFPVIEEDRNYRIVSWYQCGNDDPSFSNAAHYEFTITSYGTLAAESIFEDCVTNTFPFINFSACLSNVFTIVNLLVFREVEFNIGSATTNCYDLQVVDDWLNLSNPTICPQMPLVVRALATPILLFVMALAATHILNRRVHGY